MNEKYIKNFIFIAVGLFIITLVYPFIVNGYFENWQTSGTFGDTFGALNALYSGLAFSGLIVTILIQKKELKNQRKELKLQRTEMMETRKEFLLNRFTTLIYNQLERFERSINDLKIYHLGTTYTGYDAITFLDSIKEYFYESNEKTYQENLEDKKQAINRVSNIYIQNNTEIEKFAQNAYNSVEVVKSLIYNSTLDVNELNDLKNLFFENIGFTTMGVIERISFICEEQFSTFESLDYLRFNSEVGKLHVANVFLNSLKEFYNQKIIPDNFQTLKENWRKSKGSNY